MASRLQIRGNTYHCPNVKLNMYKLYKLSIMIRLNISKARAEFPDILNRAAYGHERTILSRRGKDLAAIISIEDLQLLERLARDEMDRIDLEDARAALAEPGENISFEQVKNNLGI